MFNPAGFVGGRIGGPVGKIIDAPGTIANATGIKVLDPARAVARFAAGPDKKRTALSTKSKDE